MVQELDFTPVDTFSELLAEAKALEVDMDAEFTEVERAVIDWQYRYYGGFFMSVFEALVKADAGNTVSMYRAFPAQTLGILAYGHTTGWWRKVQEKREHQNRLR